MNWGLRIIILYAGFVALILTLVFKATGEKIDLVSKDYYEQELLHQDKMEAIKKGNSWKDLIQLELKQHSLLVKFPEEFPAYETGEVSIYRPSDSSQDKSFPLVLNTSFHQEISTEGWQVGYYAIHLKWTYKGNHYFIEESIYIP